MVTVCTETLAEGMLVNTQGDKAFSLQHSALGLLMFSHPHGLCPLCQ
jgi:NADH dehydrogenase/NADH:ubiquinone oxidoreductase subunit G